MNMKAQETGHSRAQAWGWLTLLVLALGLGLLLLERIFDSSLGLSQEVKFLEVMTASGTVGAVVVALWLSFVQARKEQRKEAAVAELFQRMLVGNILAAWSDLTLLHTAAVQRDLPGLEQYLRSARAGFFFDALQAHVDKATTLSHTDLVAVANIYGALQVIDHEVRVWRRMTGVEADLDSLTRIVQTIEQLFQTFDSIPWIRRALPRRDADLVRRQPSPSPQASADQ
ncbi:hypothetical protein C0J09_14515 [Bordetella avium]|nr:hypothetical protein C0J09_14515 [Bordetella avium]